MSTSPDDVRVSDRTGPVRNGRTLRRPVSGRILAGVAAGLASYSGIDVTIVRIAFAVFTVVGFTGLPFLGWLPLYLFGVPLYLAGWLFIPEEGSEQSIAATMLRSLHARSR